MPSNAKDDILAAIRGYLAASAPFDAARHEHHTPQSVAAVQVALLPPVARLRQSLEAVGGRCEIVNGEDEAAEAVRTILSRIGARRVAVSDCGFEVDTAGVEFVVNADKETLFGCDAGLTSAQWGIAETGTLVLESNRERHRLASLVPPVHIALLRAENIRQTMGEVLALIEEDLSRVVTFITGPSRTSDIELTLAIGVHGPAELYVVIVESEPR
jgi:L-lactate dehydrogenase complex protein LldG